MKPAGLLLVVLLTVPSVLLSGCVAVVVPVMAGGLIAKTNIDGKSDEKPKSRHREPSPTRPGAPPTPIAGPLPQRGRPTPDKADKDVPPESRALRAGAPLQLTGLTALPKPNGAPGAADGAFAAFVHFALTAVKPKSGVQPKSGGAFRSALIDQATLASRPARANCGSGAPAVLIDLDPGKAAFDLNSPPAAAPGLAEQLASLRAAGLTILWQTSLPAEASERIHTILRAVGLDPDRTDRLLLAGKADQGKQARRQNAARDWCILAMAGDSKDDFEEAFGYLRDPEGPLAASLSANLGDGWFLTPQPIP